MLKCITNKTIIINNNYSFICKYIVVYYILCIIVYTKQQICIIKTDTT